MYLGGDEMPSNSRRKRRNRASCRHWSAGLFANEGGMYFDFGDTSFQRRTRSGCLSGYGARCKERTWCHVARPQNLARRQDSRNNNFIK